MLTLCSEIYHAKDTQAAIAPASDSAAAGPPADAASKTGSSGAASATIGPKTRSGELRRQKSTDGSASSSAAPAEAAPQAGPFGVLRKPSSSLSLQNALKQEVKLRDEELQRIQREDEQRAALVVALEQEVFQKERYLQELGSGMTKMTEHLGVDGESADVVLPEDINLTPEGLAAHERERLQRRIQEREGEATDLQQRVGALEELIREKRVEVAEKDETTLQLLFQVARLQAELEAERTRAKRAAARAQETPERLKPSADEVNTPQAWSPSRELQASGTKSREDIIAEAATAGIALMAAVNSPQAPQVFPVVVSNGESAPSA